MDTASRLRWVTTRGLLGGTLLWLAACSGDPEGEGRADARNTADLGPDIQLLFYKDVVPEVDGGLSDVSVSPQDSQTDGPDLASQDAIEDDATQPTSCEFSSAPVSGEAGATCSSGSDCKSGFCVDSADGKICTVTCGGCCPKGFGCQALQFGADSTFLCVPKWTALCRPCVQDAACAALTAGALCVSAGDAGRFCGAPCTGSGQCPLGYACQPADGTNGAGDQCVREDGPCNCSQTAVDEGASTTCANTNDYGSCAGARVCTEGGLSECSAATPAAESCDDTDNNCNGLTDEGCDDDADGFCDALLSVVGAPSVCPSGGDDCNDNAASVFPGAQDLCGNGVDDDCNGATDDVGVQPWYPDADTDGAGAGSGSVVSCQAPTGYVANALDCDDANPLVSPTAAEACNGLDDNCDGETDEAGAAGCSNFFVDQDGDGFGPALSAAQCLCGPTASHPTAKSGDCNDAAATIAPDATETCNLVDDDCDGATDETGGPPKYQDADGDGYGNPSVLTDACAAPGFVAQAGDCDDKSALVSPAGVETCDGVDQDCDAQTDENTCDDGEFCTADSCGGQAGCAFDWVMQNTPCDDGNVCTQADVCSGGTCGGTGLSCNDGNVCTTDACDGADGCLHSPIASACNDGDACTSGDACAASICSGQVISCEDNNPCTLDSCAALAGCVYTPVAGSCSDADPCTSGDICTDGQCTGAAVSCSDNNPCTLDSCATGIGCTAIPQNGLACSDGSACTASDACANGTCTGTELSCNDANPCTNDACSPATGCNHTPNTVPCDDLNACTASDNCSSGVCTGSAVQCDDFNPCTTDSCSAATGCTANNNSLTCDDGNPCTGQDKCGGGFCQGTTVVCTDGNPCTNDACVGGNCVYTNNTLACSDGNACTTTDKCGGGSCAGTPVVCNDGLSCTADSCSNGSCFHTSTCAAGFTCDVATNACKANVVGCTLPTGACTNGSESGKGCFYARTISRKTAASVATITADTCLFSDTNNFSIDGCAVDGGYDRGYRLFVRKGESLAVELTSNGSCSSAAPRLFVYRPPTGCGAPASSSCTASTLVSSCGSTKYNTTATEDAWYVLVADGDKFNEGTKYKLKVTLSNCAVAGCECP